MSRKPLNIKDIVKDKVARFSFYRAEYAFYELEVKGIQYTAGGAQGYQRQSAGDEYFRQGVEAWGDLRDLKGGWLNQGRHPARILKPNGELKWPICSSWKNK